MDISLQIWQLYFLISFVGVGYLRASAARGRAFRAETAAVIALFALVQVMILNLSRPGAMNLLFDKINPS